MRRAQHSISKTENDKLVSKLGSSDLFEEIKNLCKDKSSDLTSVVDDVYGTENISTILKTSMNTFTMSKKMLTKV